MSIPAKIGWPPPPPPPRGKTLECHFKEINYHTHINYHVQCIHCIIDESGINNSLVVGYIYDIAPIYPHLEYWPFNAQSWARQGRKLCIYRSVLCANTIYYMLMSCYERYAKVRQQIKMITGVHHKSLTRSIGQTELNAAKYTFSIILSLIKHDKCDWINSCCQS